jgi:hypothetical protein
VRESEEGALLRLEGLRALLPRPAGLMIEKLLTERSGIKGERDLLVALGLLQVSTEDDWSEFVRLAGDLSAEQRHGMVSNLTVLSLMKPMAEMPDPTVMRQEIARLITRLEEVR